jgi:hypothetical protein
VFGVIAIATTLIGFGVDRTRAAAQNQPPSTASDGRIWYDKYCTPCHGPGGVPGSATYAKSKEPVDLRTYVQRHGGKFPAGDWLSVVFAETPHNPHTALWQRMRRDEVGSGGTETTARAKVRTIADYIVSIQTTSRR